MARMARWLMLLLMCIGRHRLVSSPEETALCLLIPSRFVTSIATAIRDVNTS